MALMRLNCCAYVQAAPAVHGSQKKKEAKIEALSTAPPAVHAEPLTQQLLQPSQRTAPKTIAIKGKEPAFQSSACSAAFLKCSGAIDLDNSTIASFLQ